MNRPPDPEAAGHLLSWLRHDPSGQRLLAAERESLNALLRSLPGEVLLELSPIPGLTVRNGCRRLCLAPPGGCGDIGALVAPMRLPLWPGSVPLAVLHHVLETALDPRRVVSEAALAVREGGHLLTVAFNRGPSRWLHRMPSQRNAPPLSRLRHWLLSSGMQPVRVAYCDSRFPHRLFGRSCIVMSRKQRIPMTPARRRWRIRAAEWIGQPAVALGPHPSGWRRPK